VFGDGIISSISEILFEVVALLGLVISVVVLVKSICGFLLLDSPICREWSTKYLLESLKNFEEAVVNNTAMTISNPAIINVKDFEFIN